jgi:hypothetical protein
MVPIFIYFHIPIFGMWHDHVKQLTRSKHEAHGGEDDQLATAMEP